MTENIYADSSVSGNCSTPDNALGVADGTFTTDTGNVSWTHTWHLPAPSTGAIDSSATQTFVFRVRKQTGSGTPSISGITILFDQGGGSWIGQAVFGSTNVTSSTGEDITKASAFSGLIGFSSRVNDEIRIEIATTGAGGSPSNRAAVQIDATNWQAEVTTGGGGGAADSVGILYG